MPFRAFRCRPRFAALLACTALSGALVALAGKAEAQTWLGTTDTNWSTATNWSTGVVPVAGGTVTINNGALANQPNVTASQSAAQTNVSAGTLAIGATLTSPLTLSGGGVATINAGGDVVGTITVGTGSALQLNSWLGAGAPVILNGTGVANGGALRNLAGNNIVAGTVTLASDARINTDAQQMQFDALVSGTNVNLTVGGAGTTYFNGNLSLGSGSLTMDGAGVLFIPTVNTSTGTTTVTTGDLFVQNGQAVADTSALVVNGGRFGVFSNETVGSLAGSGGQVLGSAATLSVGGDNTSTSYAGSLVDNGGAFLTLTKIGTGTQTLTGNSTYSGVTTVSGGTLVAGSATALGATAGGTVVQAGATLRIANVNIGNEALSIAGAGVGGAGALVGTGTATAGGAVTLTADATIGTTASSDSLTLSGAVGGAFALTKVGQGTLTLSGPNTYTGRTTVAATAGVGGILVAANAAALGTTAGDTVVQSGSTLQIAGVAIGAEAVSIAGTGVGGIGALQGTGAASLAGAVTLTGNASVGVAAAATLQLTGGVGGGFELTKVGAGTLTISGGTVATSAVTVSVGTLSLINAVTVSAPLSNLATTTIDATSQLTGGATNTGTLTNAGTIGGGLTNNAGTTTNTGTINGGATVAGGTLDTQNVLNGGLANGAAGIVQARGQVNGGVVNNGAFSVTGALTGSGGGFTNQGISTLDVNAGRTLTFPTVSLTGGSLTSTGTINAATSFGNAGIAALAGQLNTAAATNSGTLTVTANLANTTVNSTFTNSGTVQVNGGAAFTLANNLGLSPQGSLFTNNGTLTVAAGGTLDIGHLDNNGTLTVAGTLIGRGASLINTNTLNLANGAVLQDAVGITNTATGTINVLGTTTVNSPVFANNGLIAVTAGSPAAVSLTGASISGTGTINLRPGTAIDATRSLTVGNVTGNQTVQISLDPTNGTAGRIIATAAGTGTGSLTFNIQQTSLRPTSAPITVAEGVTNTAVTATGQVAFGFVTTSIVNTSPGLWQVSTTVSPNAGAPAASISSVVTALSTGFFSSTNAFVTSPTSEQPNKLHGGPWVRVQAGQYDTSGLTSVSFGATAASAPTKVRTQFGGFQLGTDIGLLNVGGTGANVHIGVMAGSVDANADQKGSATPTTGKFSVPFVGAYAALIYGAFSADLQVRHDYYTVDLSNSVGFNGALLGQKAEGDSINGSATYRFNLPYDIFLEPSVGFNVTRVSMNPLFAAAGGGAGVQGGTITFSSVDSRLGRAGVRVGTTFIYNDKVIFQPFATAAVWREFAGTSRSFFSFTGSNDVVAIGSSRVGTFGQLGVGLTSQIIGTNLVGYIRGDVRFGEHINGGSVNAGIRYDF